jgi:GAF domain-containing protein
VIFIRRSEVRPFTERQIELVKTFADQAVIAIENTRLFNETKESLDRQKASADILAVISSSIADAQPVFDRIVASCERLFAGKLVGINLVGDDGLIRVGAYHGRGREEFEKVFPMALSPDSGTGRAILERRVLHYPDVMNGRDVPEGVKRGCAAVGTKACIFAPLLWEGRGLLGRHLRRPRPCRRVFGEGHRVGQDVRRPSRKTRARNVRSRSLP